MRGLVDLVHVLFEQPKVVGEHRGIVLLERVGRSRNDQEVRSDNRLEASDVDVTSIGDDREGQVGRPVTDDWLDRGGLKLRNLLFGHFFFLPADQLFFLPDLLLGEVPNEFYCQNDQRQDVRFL